MKKVLLFFCCIIICGNCFAQNNAGHDSVYIRVDNMPVFPGDVSAYLKKHLHYPESAFNNNIEGAVYLSFIVSKIGQVTSVKVEKGLSADLDSAAVQVVDNMPQWVPGKQKGVAVNVKLYLPIKFTIDKGNAVDTSKTYSLKRKFSDRKGLYVIAHIGGGLCEIGDNNYFLSASTNGLQTVNVYPLTIGGAEMEYMFNNHFGASIGAQVQKYKGRFVSVLTGNVPVAYNSDVVYSFSFLQSPVLFKYISSKPGYAGLCVEAGFLYGTEVSASESGTVTQIITLYVNNSIGQTLTIANPAPKPLTYSRSDNGFMLNIGAFIPFSDKLSLAVNVCSTIKFNNSIGNGGNDIANFGKTSYNYFQGEYGKADSYLLDFKFLIRLGKPSTPSP